MNTTPNTMEVTFEFFGGPHNRLTRTGDVPHGIPPSINLPVGISSEGTPEEIVGPWNIEEATYVLEEHWEQEGHEEDKSRHFAFYMFQEEEPA